MPSTVRRGGGSYPVKFAADGSGTVLQLAACSGGILLVTSGAGTLELCCVEKPGDDPAPLINNEAQPCTFAVSDGNAYELPTAIYAATYVVVRGADVEGIMFVKG